MALITVGGLESATIVDVLNGTRLLTLGPGVVTIECQASDADATNNYAVSVQLPNGATPWNGVPVPTGNHAAGVGGVIDDRCALIGQFVIQPGDEGHMVLGFTETGAATCAWRVTHVAA